MALSDLKYVTTGAWGTGLARPLTAVEADGNIQTLRAAIQNLIDNPVEGVSVSNITVSGRQLTFHMSDASTFGPFTLPIAYPRYRGTWAAATSYAVFDIVQTDLEGTFLVALDHTSAAEFVPNATSGGNALYVQIQAPIYRFAPVYTTSTDAITLNISWAGYYVRCTNATGVEVTLPPNVFDFATEMHFRQVGDGPISFVLGSGVTMNVPAGYTAATAAAGDTLTIKNVGSNAWDVFGNLTPAP